MRAYGFLLALFFAACRVCGNGDVEKREACDDGNALSGDGCSASCQIEPPTKECGDGVVDGAGACSRVFFPDEDTLALFEFNRAARDSSGNNRSGTLLGGELVDAQCGNGLHVSPGVGPVGLDWSAFASQLAHPFTIEMVLTPQNTVFFSKLFSFDDAADGGWYYVSNGFTTLIGSIGDQRLGGGSRQYLALVSTSDSELEVFFQGASLGVIPMGFTAPPPQAIFFRDDAATGRGEQVDAVIDALRISNVARSAQEIADTQFKIGGESCDDGNNTDGDGCSADCLFSQVCGNSIAEGSEGCDDGDLTAGDGCDDVCQVEPDFVCSGVPSICELSCGNGDLDAGEQCDDGNTADGDGCDSDCAIEPPLCGNSVIQTGEICDDGNQIDGDGCSADCLSDETCGNLVVDTPVGEQCDDGNQIDGDGCSASCLVQ